MIKTELWIILEAIKNREEDEQAIWIIERELRLKEIEKNPMGKDEVPLEQR